MRHCLKILFPSKKNRQRIGSVARGGDGKKLYAQAFIASLSALAEARIQEVAPGSDSILETRVGRALHLLNNLKPKKLIVANDHKTAAFYQIGLLKTRS